MSKFTIDLFTGKEMLLSGDFTSGSTANYISLKSPNGTIFKLAIDNDGNLYVE